jgi:hypothetical protein
MYANDLIEHVGDDQYLLSKVPELIGKETDAAERMRQIRLKRNNVQECSNLLENVQYIEIKTDQEIKTKTKTKTKKEREIESSGDDQQPKLSSKSDSLHVPYGEIVSLFNEVLGGVMPKIEIISETRKSAMKQRTRDRLHTLDDWKWYFDKIKSSDWLMGKTCGSNGKPFRCNFDWITNSSNFIKIIEGNYDRVATNPTHIQSGKYETGAQEINRTDWSAWSEEKRGERNESE